MTGRRSPRSPWLLAVASVVVLAAPAVAPAAKVTVRADRQEAQVGQPVVVTVRVRRAADTPTVKPPDVVGARLEQVGQPTSISTLAADLEASGAFHSGMGHLISDRLKSLGQLPNMAALDPDVAKLLGDPNLLKGQQGLAGLDTSDYVFTYQVTPDRSGPLTVPGFSVSVDGRSETTPPLSVNVTEARPQQWVQMRLSLSDPAPIVGEEVQLHVDLLIQRGEVTYGGKTYPYLPVSKMALTLPPLDGLPAVEPAQLLEQVVQENAIEPGKQGFRVNNIPGAVKMEHEPADGKDLDPARYRRRLSIPLRVRAGGEVTLAAARAAGDVFVPAGGNKGQWEPFVVSSEPLTFSVLDLRRRADRPAEFTGAIGEVRVTARASQTQMAAGTPFTLTLRLEGNGSVASALAPDLAARTDFSRGFKVRHEETKTLAGNVRQFTYTLRPLSEDVKQVPAVPVGYFDPKTNKFGTARSEPIPLRVTAAANATPDAPPAAAAPAAAALAPTAQAEPERASQSGSLLPWLEGAMAAALVVCGTAWGVSRFRRPPAVAARPVATPVVAARRREPPPPAPTFATVRETLQDFLRQCFQLPPGEVTPRDAEECLLRGGVPQGLARSFAALLDTCETAEFAPGVVNTSPSDLATYARQLMEQIRTAIPNQVAV